MASNPFAYRLYRAFWLTLDWVFPPQCVGCGRVGARFCEDCLASVARVPEPVCERCGAPLRAWGMEQGLCPACRRFPPAFAAARSWAVMTGSVRRAVHRLKYHHDLALADILAAQMLPLVRRLGWAVDGVVPVPLSAGRQKARGYNQAAMLAFPLALGLGVPYWGKVLVRVRETRSQVGLKAAERRRNVADAFRIAIGHYGKAPIYGKNVLLVDDVMTTGATLSAAAQALREGGAAQVYAVTVARAVLGWVGDGEKPRGRL